MNQDAAAAVADAMAGLAVGNRPIDTLDALNLFLTLAHRAAGGEEEHTIEGDRVVQIDRRTRRFLRKQYGLVVMPEDAAKELVVSYQVIESLHVYEFN
jgi:hypothetical protein